MSSSSLSRLFRCSGRLAGRRTLPSSSSTPSRPPTPTPTSVHPPLRSPNNSLEDVVDSLFRETDLDRLVSRFKEASASPRFRAKHRIFEVAVNRLAAAGRLDGVAGILEEQKRYGVDIAREGFAARLIGLYGRACMPVAAEETFRQLPSLGCRRTVLSFNALLTACADSSDFETMEKLFRTVPVESPGIVPDHVSYNIVISSMCRRNDADAAMCMLETMEERGKQPNLITFNTLLNGFYANGDFIGAEKVWDKMKEKKCVPDVKSFNAKLRGLVLEGKISEAVELVGRLPSMGLKPDTFSFNALIKGHCQDGNLDDAKVVFESLTKNGCRPNRATFETLLPRLCESGQLDLALHMCNESMSRRCYLAAEVLQGVVDRLLKDSRVEDAKKLVELAWSSCYDEKSIRMHSASI